MQASVFYSDEVISDTAIIQLNCNVLHHSSYSLLETIFVNIIAD